MERTNLGPEMDELVAELVVARSGSVSIRTMTFFGKTSTT